MGKEKNIARGDEMNVGKHVTSKSSLLPHRLIPYSAGDEGPGEVWYVDNKQESVAKTGGPVTRAMGGPKKFWIRRSVFGQRQTTAGKSENRLSNRKMGGGDK